MIRSYTATTREIDDEKAAVAEILGQLEPEKNLLKNSLGIVACFSDFVETGVLKAVCGALPFDCIGATTCISASDGQTDEIILALTVLTSDDCSFETVGLPIGEGYEQSVKEDIGGLLARREEKPALILSYFPLINEISGDMILSAIDGASGGIPLFGTAAVDHTMDYSTSQTILNGEGFRASAVLGAVYGSPDVTYEVASLNEERIRKQKAVITQSNGNILIGVNGKTALEYLEEVGLTKQELATGLGIVPLVVDHKDGTDPVARAVFALTPEGYAICGGAMPVNATLGLGGIDEKDVLSTTEKVLSPLAGGDGVILSYSCMARFLVLGADNSAEARRVTEIAGGGRYMYACSGGEICPLPDAEGKLRNFYHNYTNVFCRLS